MQPKWTPVSLRSMYRQVLRQLNISHKAASVEQNAGILAREAARKKLKERAAGAGSEISEAPAAPEIPVSKYDTSSLRKLFETPSIRPQDVEEIAHYLKHQRQYKELLKRYQTGPKSRQERVRMSARRVGLDADHLG